MNTFSFEQTVPTNNITIQEIVIYPVNGYNQQWLRPLQINLDAEKLNRVQEVLDRKYVQPNQFEKRLVNTNVTGAEIASTVPDLLNISTVPIAAVDIPYGWQEKRGIFTLIAVQKHSSDSETITYIQGYTEYLDVSRSGFLPDDMKFYINSIIEIAKTFNHTTGQWQYRIMGHYAVTHTHNGFQVTNLDTGEVNYIDPYQVALSDGNSIVTAKPSDILRNLGSRKIVSDMTDNTIDILNDTGLLAINGRPTQTADYVDRTVTSTTGHLAKTLTGVLASTLNTDIGYDDSDILFNAAELSTPTRPSDIPFINQLLRLNRFKLVNYFTLAQLKLIDPTLDKNRITVFASGTLERLSAVPKELVANESEDLAMPTKENSIATYISEFMVHALSENGLLSATITMNNLDGNYNVFILGAVPAIPGLPVETLLEKIRLRIVNELLPTITERQLHIIDVVVHTDIRKETRIHLSLNGRPPVPYVIPIFADGLFNPIISNKKGFEQLVTGYNTILENTILGI